MAMNNREDSFALALAFEVVAAEIRGRHRLERKKRSGSHRCRENGIERDGEEKNGIGNEQYQDH